MVAESLRPCGAEGDAFHEVPILTYQRLPAGCSTAVPREWVRRPQEQLLGYLETGGKFNGGR